MTTTTKHLWEVEHSYYMTTGNYYSNDCHNEWDSWADFLEDMGDADLDMNWVVRWDWREADPVGYDPEDGGPEPYNGDDNVRNGIFDIQIVGQRKARLSSHSISVCRADEASILEYLRPRWEYMQGMWAPLSGEGA